MNGMAKFSVVLYGRAGCHLCEQVERMIQKVAVDYPLELTVIDIQSEMALEEKFMLTIPAVAIDGEEVFLSETSVVTEEQFRAELQKRTAAQS
ncbi:glutaredoxin family protein [Brevibacillus fulvus]|uniref:Glutaredoxin n=1 Tax=Brevibacillus fulvus TaxID=1125967 RepID=A0A939BTS8_9BACL|nr:glutaredoxin family protein [Brevibacillus fulvus]MBM7592127.1 glutaredoxin [Brevibacillus fulvus]